MNAKKFAVVASLIVALIFAFGASWQMQAQENKTPYPNMAPLDQYLMDRDAEIALARSAALLIHVEHEEAGAADILLPYRRDGEKTITFGESTREVGTLRMLSKFS